MLTVGSTAHTGKAVAFNDSLETLSFGSTDDIDKLDTFEDVCDCQGVAQVKLSFEVCLKFGKLALRSGSCLFEMPFERGAGVFFSGFVIGKLNGGITIFFYRTNLRNNTRTSLNNGAWNILSISTENGSHSDFLSN